MFYIFVGGKGNDGGKIGILIPTGGWNGGGNGSMGYDDDEQTGGAGGGATDIRITNGSWNDFNSLKSRIIVASGGAGTQSFINHSIIPVGGGINGKNGTASKNIGSGNITIRFAAGGSQTSGGVSAGGTLVPLGSYGSSGYGNNGGFGYGGASNNIHGGGGGSGYYGGGGGRSHYYGRTGNAGTIDITGRTSNRGAYRNTVTNSSSRMSSLRDRASRMSGGRVYNSGNTERSSSGNFSGRRGGSNSSYSSSSRSSSTYSSPSRSSGSSFGSSSSSGSFGGSRSSGGGGGGGSRMGGRR